MTAVDYVIDSLVDDRVNAERVEAGAERCFLMIQLGQLERLQAEMDPDDPDQDEIEETIVETLFLLGYEQ